MRARKLLMAGLVVGLAAAGIFATPTVSSASDDTVHIRFSTWHPPASREVKTVWEPMLEEMKKRSNGRITYTLYAGGALGKGPEHFDIVKNGLSDMGYFTASWTPGRFPKSDVLSLATSVDSKATAATIGKEMYEKELKDEFEGVKVMELNGCIQAFIWTRQPVKTLEDLKSLKIRTPGGHQTNYIKALGAEPVFMPLGDVYLALETGTIDGLVTCSPLVLAFKLHEVVKYGVKATFGCVTEGVVANQKFWDKVPDDLKTIIEDVASNPYAATGGLDHKVYGEMISEIESKGVTLYELPAEESTRWSERFQDETRKWVKELESEGKNAKEAVVMYNDIVGKEGITCTAFPAEWHE
ncbi:MAG: ABC transporter substrate-binding protein [Deltaproteobacteria bacterium]|nr:MAG: ABC transporter substrate-binding protein [Deltaproteobacteria bacterium]